MKSKSKTKLKSEKLSKVKLFNKFEIDKHTYDQIIKWSRRAIKFVGFTIIFIACSIFIIWLIFGRSRLTDPEDILWGVTYSPLPVEDLKMNSDETLTAIVDDLKPNRIRLVAYWNRIEKYPGQYDFSELDKQVDLVDSRNIPFIISVGRRVPRYPECHEPEWADALPIQKQEEEVLELIKATMDRYDDRQNLIYWQIENEPFLSAFGECPPLNEEYLDKEISMAKTISDKPIMTTESGELSFWLKASKYPDILGTTLYRTVIVSDTNVAVNHIFPPWYYRARSNVAKLVHKNLDKIIVAELQGEPWTNEGIINSTDEEIARTMSRKQFEKNIDFTESVGFEEVYWWGVEWWYYEKLSGNNYYWERARSLFQD